MLDIKETGTVKDIKKSIVTVNGLPNCMIGQLVNFESGARGIIMSFDEEECSVLVFTGNETIRPKDPAIARIQELTVPAGEDFLGRIVNPLGEPLDRKGPIKHSDLRPVLYKAAGVLDREPISEALETGIKVIDAVIPIGKGQRELIIGDRVTGKTTMAIDSILNQKGKDVVCVYCCTGKSYSHLSKIIQLFQRSKAFEYSIVVSAPAFSSPGEQYLAPYTAAALGEYFMYDGKDVLVVFDDLSKHAWIYREISLLMDSPPGRDAYPGDIFYLHSHLMERAAKLSSKLGGGSMTFLPIVETSEGDITGYIPSNLISMTDGQIYLSTDLFKEGVKPAVDLELSVSRIGHKVQHPALRDLSETLRLEYIQYKRLARMTKIKADISKDVEIRLKKGEALTKLLSQDRDAPVTTEEQIILLYALRQHVLDDLPNPKFDLFKEKIFSFMLQNNPDLVKAVAQKKELNDRIMEGLNESFKEFFYTHGGEASVAKG